MDLFYWILTIVGLVGVVLNIKQDRRCFFLWMVSNAGFALETAILGAWNMTFLFVVYFILAIAGIKSWSKNSVREVV